MSLLPPWSIETQDHDLARAAAQGDVARLRALIPGLRWSLTGDVPPIDRTVALSTLDVNTPLGHATLGGHVEAITVLLDAGAKVNHAGSSGMTPLALAVMYEQTRAIPVLLAAGADPNAISTGMGYTPLMLAVVAGHLDLVQRLIDLGARPDVPGGLMNTVLHIAVEQKGQDLGPIVTLLIARGAVPSARNANGCTPLEWAATSFGAGVRSGAAQALVAHAVNQEQQALRQALDAAPSSPPSIVPVATGPHDARRRL